MINKIGPVLAVLAVIIGLWYLACMPMNIRLALDTAERQGAVITPEGRVNRQEHSAIGLVIKNPQHVAGIWSQKKPRLPAPHQVVAELWRTTMEVKPTSKRSLVLHGWVTLSATGLGFIIGSLSGVLLAIGIVHNRAMDMSVMPWAIASQTIPILAIAPMIIVVLASVGLQGLIPKALISAYLSFFPVVVGMVKGLRSPSHMDLDLMQTWSATRSQIFWKLRMPASAPYLFASLKIGVASSLVGTIVAELPAGGGQGLGARLLSGSYYGQTVQIWAALFATAILAAALVALIGGIEKGVLKRMGLAG
ncbi:ABC transporter permease [Pseudooceanicola sp. HF7]|uniref:ABC transporter permease n=1 Tax=Pseudooceanicola sp. HF7 TaxID=2721560 RepID=UPI00142F4CC1|nr:ABC transporter permease [Pseudooceanicola sp. HF7]NIZ08070.1 ABC transporter permease [Pseudooceanicola sp. HF7]